MTERLVLEGLKPFIGKHCETSALKHVLDYHKLFLSEDMLFGLGGGIGFIYWHMKFMPVPFVGARYGKGTDFPANICRRIGAGLSVVETNSQKKGYDELKGLLRAGEPAVLYADMAYFPYLVIPEVAHFGGHVVVVFGLDEEKDKVYIYDRGKNPVTVSIDDLVKARGSKFQPFPPKHRILKIKYPAKIGELQWGIKEAIKDSCHNMLRPPIKNIGLAGMEKWSKLVVKWPEQFQGLNLLGSLMNGFIYIEIGGTGGSAFRPMYARFLEEASLIIHEPALKEIAEMMRQSAVVWSEIASELLPDSWPNLRAMRELMLEKNSLFEEQEPGALGKMVKINQQINGIMEKALEDLKRTPDFLVNVQHKIMECRVIEEKAFQKLTTIIA